MDPKWVIGGVCVAAGVGLLLFYMADDGKGSHSSTAGAPLRRDQLLEVLKELKKESASNMITLAGFAMSIKEQTQNRIDDAYLREILSSQSSRYLDPVNEQMKRSEEKVYQKFAVTEDQVRRAYEVEFKSDPCEIDREVARIAKEMQEAMENAYKGVAPKSDSRLPDFLTPDKLIEVLKAMYNTSAKVTLKKLEELRRQGVQFNPYDQRFVAATQNMEAEVEEAKCPLSREHIYEKFGLTSLEDPASLVINNAIQKFSHNVAFMSKMTKLENEYRTKMQGIMMGRMGEADRNPMTDDGPDDEEEQKLIQYMETAMMGVEQKTLEEEVNLENKPRRAKIEEIKEEEDEKPTIRRMGTVPVNSVHHPATHSVSAEAPNVSSKPETPIATEPIHPQPVKEELKTDSPAVPKPAEAEVPIEKKEVPVPEQVSAPAPDAVKASVPETHAEGEAKQSSS